MKLRSDGDPSHQTNLHGVSIDHGREARTGFPEVVYGATKTALQIETILREMIEQGGFALASRVPPETAGIILERIGGCSYDATSSCLGFGRRKSTGSTAALVCAGTSDIPIAAEASFVLEALGHSVREFNDVGVAGVHRLLSQIESINACDVVIVIAGMEGALPSVVAGITSKPVIAVPTSVGYGVSSGGFAALITMLSSCAPGIGVVNIDNGVGAAALAHKIMNVARR